MYEGDNSFIKFCNHTWSNHWSATALVASVSYDHSLGIAWNTSATKHTLIGIKKKKKKDRFYWSYKIHYRYRLIWCNRVRCRKINIGKYITLIMPRVVSSRNRFLFLSLCFVNDFVFPSDRKFSNYQNFKRVKKIAFFKKVTSLANLGKIQKILDYICTM